MPGFAVRQGFCRECYKSAIARLCAGFTITRPGGKGVTEVPPLPPRLAISVRRAAAAYLEGASQGDTARHPDHVLMPL